MIDISKDLHPVKLHGDAITFFTGLTCVESKGRLGVKDKLVLQGELSKAKSACRLNM